MSHLTTLPLTASTVHSAPARSSQTRPFSQAPIMGLRSREGSIRLDRFERIPFGTTPPSPSDEEAPNPEPNSPPPNPLREGFLRFMASFARHHLDEPEDFEPLHHQFFEQGWDRPQTWVQRLTTTFQAYPGLIDHLHQFETDLLRTHSGPLPPNARYLTRADALPQVLDRYTQTLMPLVLEPMSQVAATVTNDPGALTRAQLTQRYRHELHPLFQLTELPPTHPEAHATLVAMLKRAMRYELAVHNPAINQLLLQAERQPVEPEAMVRAMITHGEGQARQLYNAVNDLMEAYDDDFMAALNVISPFSAPPASPA